MKVVKDPAKGSDHMKDEALEVKATSIHMENVMLYVYATCVLQPMEMTICPEYLLNMRGR